MNVSAACLAVLITVSSPLIGAPNDKPGKAALAAGKEQPQGFPLEFKGKEVMITCQAKHADLEAALTKILGEKTGMEDKSRLQYDAQLDPNQAPLGVVLDWDKQDRLVRVTLDAFSESQNPVAKTLKGWLTKNAGTGKTIKNKKTGYTTTTWDSNGWNFVFTRGGDGEDSTYAFHITLPDMNHAGVSGTSKVAPEMKTITGKFTRVKMDDIVATIVFEMKDGSQIGFYRNTMVPQEPKLDYDLIAKDGSGANKKLIGRTFSITYKVDPEGKTNPDGTAVAANLIQSLKAK